jgi:Reverse transcriptase-like
MVAVTLHAYVAAAELSDGRAGVGVIFVDDHGRAVRRVGRALSGVASLSLASFRGIVHALWNSRRLGFRRIVVHCPDQAVVAQINGDQEVPEEFVGPYLEVRALLHAYRVARVESSREGAGEVFWPREAAALAEGAGDRDVDETVQDLPLWSGLAEQRSSA